MEGVFSIHREGGALGGFGGYIIEVGSSVC